MNLKKNILKFLLTIQMISIFIFVGIYFATPVFANEPKIEFYLQTTDQQQNVSNEDISNYIETVSGRGGSYESIKLNIYAKSLNGDNVISTMMFHIQTHEDYGFNIKQFSSAKDEFGDDIWKDQSGAFIDNMIVLIRNSDFGDLDEKFTTEGALVGTVVLEINAAYTDSLYDTTIDFSHTEGSLLNPESTDITYGNEAGEGYALSEITFTPFVIGNPNSGPDASLSTLKVEGLSENYLDLTKDDLHTNLIHPVTISYQDSLNNNLSIEALPKKGSAQVEINGLKSNYSTGDEIEIVVTDETVTKTYMIEITVTDPNDDTSLQLTTNKEDAVKESSYTSETEYQFVVNYNTYEIQVNPVIHELSTASKTSLNFSGLQPGVQQSQTITVTAENGDTKTYTIKVLREIGNSDTGFELKINSQDITKEASTYAHTLLENEDRFAFTISGFEPTTKIYYKVGRLTSVLEADYQLLPLNGTIANILVKKNEKITYTILSVAEDGTKELSYIEVTRMPSTNVHLKTVTINEIAGTTSHTQDLTPMSGTYTYTVKDNQSDRLIMLITGIQNEGQTIQILNNDNQPITDVLVSNLNVGDNEFTIRVIAQDGTTQRNYPLIIKKLSDEKSVTNMELRNSDDGSVIALGIGGTNGFTYDAAAKRYHVTLEYSQVNNFELILTTSDKSIILINNISTATNIHLLNGSFTLKTLQNIDFNNITIKAENGTVTESFNIRISRKAADTNNQLIDLQMNGVTVNGFMSNKTDYPVTIFDRDTNFVYIEAFLPTDSKATISYYINNTLVANAHDYNLAFSNHEKVDLEVRVTSEAGVVFTYKVPLIAASNDSSIQNIQIFNAQTDDILFNGFNALTFDYLNITVPYSVGTIKVVVTTTDSHATVMGVTENGIYTLNTTYPLNLNIFGKSEAGVESNLKYKFSIQRQSARSYKNLETLSVKYFDANNQEIIKSFDVDASNKFTIRVDNDVTPIFITATVLGLQGERITGATDNVLKLTENFTDNEKNKTISIIVVDEGGASKTYTLEIIRKNNDKTFESVRIGNRTYGMDEFDANYKLTLDNVLFSTDRLDIEFHMVPQSNSTIQSPQSFIGNYTQGTWFFNDKTGLLTATFQVKSEYEELSPTYTIEVYRQPALSSKTLNSLMIQSGSNILLNASAPVNDTYELRVDRGVATVDIRLTIPMVDRSSIGAPYVLSGNDGVDQIYTYTLNLNNPNASAATIHTINVYAEDGTLKTYQITIWRRNANINIQEITIKHGEQIIHSGSMESAAQFLGTFDYDATELTFIIKPLDPYARISINGQRLTPTDGIITTTIPLVVGQAKEIQLKIESDITQNEMPSEVLSKSFIFTYDKKAASHTAELDFLEAIVGGNDILDGETLDFTNENVFGDFVVGRNLSSVLIQATAKDGGTVTGIGSRVLSIGRNEIIVTVKSQSGQYTKDYMIVIYRNNDNNNIANIEVEGHNINYDASILNYDLGTVLYDETTLKIDVTLVDNLFAKYYVNQTLLLNEVTLKDGLNTITIQAESDIGTKGDIYTITVFKEAPFTDVTLNDLVVTFDDGSTNQITFNPNTFTYTIQLLPTEFPNTVHIIPTLKNDLKQRIITSHNLEQPIDIQYQSGEINQTIQFTVEAENQVKQTYTIVIKKGQVQSNDFSIHDILLTHSYTSLNLIEFDPTLFEYNINVAYRVDQINLEVYLNDLKATLTYTKKPNLLMVGENVFEFFVTAENGQKGPTYKINITRDLPSTHNELLEILIYDPLQSGHVLLGLPSKNPAVVFDGQQTYTLTFNEAYLNQFLTITTTKANDAQTITGDVNRQLMLDAKTKRFDIHVAPEDPNGVTKTYVVHVVINHEDNKLTSLKIDNQFMNLTEPVISYTTLKDVVSIETNLQNIYGDVVVKDQLGQVISNNNLTLDFGLNEFTIDVYNELGVIVESHTVEVYRQKHADKDIENISLIGSDSNNYLTNFDPSQLVYHIKVPLDVDKVTLSGQISNTATLIGKGVYTIEIDTTKTITFYVEAQNGDVTDTYTIYVTKRSLSKENTLDEIRFTDPLDSTRYILANLDKNPLYTFNPNQKDYTIELGLAYVGKQITIRYVLMDPNQTVTGVINGEAIILNRGVNQFKLTVYPEDIDHVDPLIYTVTIMVKNKENDLIDFQIDQNNINFDANQTASFTTEKENVLLSYTTMNHDGYVLIKDSLGEILDHELDLEVGNNAITIEVYNEFEQLVQTYSVEIQRNLSSQTDIIDVQLTDNTLHNYLTFDETILDYEVSVPFDVESLNLSIEAFHKANVYIDNIHHIDGSKKYILSATQTITFYVEAENGDLSATYTITIHKLPNTNNLLKSLTIETNEAILLDDATFDPKNNLYVFEVSEQHTQVVFKAIKDIGQTITGVVLDQAIVLNHGNNIFKIEVQPEDLNTETFIIDVHIKVIYQQVDIDYILVDGENIYRDNQYHYILEDVTSDVANINIEVQLKNPYGEVKINNQVTEQFIADLLPGQNNIQIEVTSEDGKTTKTYTIEVNQLLNDVDTLDMMRVKTNLDTYLLGSLDDNAHKVFDANTFTYAFEVNEDITFIVVDVLLGFEKQTIVGPIQTELTIVSGLNTFEFFVTPEDSSLETKTYRIEITKLYDEITVQQLLVDGTDIYEAGIFDYLLDAVTNDVDSIEVIPNLGNHATYEIYDTQNNLVSENVVHLIFGINTIKVVVTSESGLNQVTYTITIEQTYSDNHEIMDVRFFDASTNVNRLNFDPEITDYQIEFPATTQIARLRVETHNKASVYINGVHEINTRKDFTLTPGASITVEFYVVAENGSVGKTYTFNVYQRLATDPVLSDNTNLYDVTIEVPIEEVHFDFDPSIYEYRVHIPYKYEEIYIKGHTESLGARVTNEGAYRLTPGVEKVIRLRVTAEDGTVASKAYVFTLIRGLPNSDTTLKNLVVEDLSGETLQFDQFIFDPENRVYNITLPEEKALNKVNVFAEKNHDTQTLYNVGIIDLHGEIAGYYNTIITVTVVAEDGSVGEYIIYVLHDLDFAGIAEVKDISIIGNDGISYFGLEFEDNIYHYDDIVVPFTVNTTRLIVQTIGNIIYLDNNLNPIEDNRIQAFDTSSKITYKFMIESTNGQNKSEVYTIVVNRLKPDTNNLLKRLEINGETIKGFDPNIFEYHYIHPLQFESYLDIYAVAQSNIATIRGNDVYTLIEGQTRTIYIEVTAESQDVAIYTIHIAYVNSNALLGQLIVYEMIDNQEIENTIPLKDDTLEYLVIIGKTTNYVNIKGFAKDQGGASIRGFGIRQVGAEDTVVDIIVTSGDGLEEITYKLTLRKDTSLSSLKEITSLQINGDDVINTEDDPYIYRYEMSNNSSKINLSAITNNTSRIAINGGEFSHHNKGEIEILDVINNQVVRISVMAEDGSIQHYMVIIELPEQPNMLLTILLILSILLWVVTTMIYILKRIKNKNKKDRNQLIF